MTFETKMDATAWLDGKDPVKVEAERNNPLLSDYADNWLRNRTLKPRSRAEYRRDLDQIILPSLGTFRLNGIKVTTVRSWWESLDPGKPNARSHAYLLLHAILQDAWRDDLIPANPCRIRGAGAVKTKHDARPATLTELATIVEAMPERYRLMVLLAAWCALRFGELTELRRADVVGSVVRVQRGVVRVDGAFLIGDPKSDAGVRNVSIPPHLAHAVREHLERVGSDPDALLFPAAGDPTKHLAPSTLYKVYYPAREAAGRADLHFHDLRHTGATLAAATGATLADLMARLGHSTVTAAMRYQHAAQDRDTAIGLALSDFATAGTVSLNGKTSTG